MIGKYVTIVGVDQFFGITIFKVGQVLMLRKDHENRFDDEAIEVIVESVDGKTGYVANSCKTVAKGTRSAGRIYDAFGEVCRCRVLFIIKNNVIAELLETERIGD